MRFATDKMLGRLARWLRVIGQDVAYGPHLSGVTLLHTARREARVILTRDTRLLRRHDLPPHLFITSDHFREQLRQVISAFDLDPQLAMFTRCLECNEALCDADPSRVRSQVPAYVRMTQKRFRMCPRCHRIFWAATHQERMRAELERLGVLRAERREDRTQDRDHGSRKTKNGGRRTEE